MLLNEFKAGDIVGNGYNYCFEIKQVFNNGNVKIKVINLDPTLGFEDVKGNELKKDKIYVVDPDWFCGGWELIEPKKSEIENAKDHIQTIKNRISNAKKELELAELELKNIAEKKSEIDVTKNLIPERLYKIIDEDGDTYFGFFVRMLDYGNNGYNFEFLVKYDCDNNGPERISKRWFSKKELNENPPELIDTKETKLMGKYVIGFFNSYSVETKEQ